MGHPLHPIFVHLPVGLWLASLGCDLIFMISGNPVMAAVSYYCILFGLIGVAFALPTGVAEYASIPFGTEPKRIAKLHMSLNLFATLLYIVGFFNRHGLEDGIPSLVTRGEIVLSTFSMAIVAASGYLGGILVYKYGIGMRPVPAAQPHAEVSKVRRAA
jgi:uncharacterized membrane protein